MKLALRKSNSGGFLHKLFNIATRWRLHTVYPHSGIVIGNQLYHTTYSNGLHAVEFDPEGWELFDVGGNDAFAVTAFNYRRGADYDAISLLAFLLPWCVRDSHRLYCYEWCWLAMTGENPSHRITPEMLLSYAMLNKGQP